MLFCLLVNEFLLKQLLSMLVGLHLGMELLVNAELEGLMINVVL